MGYKLYAGIYTIKCIENGKVYVGRSVQVPIRRKRHEYDLRDGVHTNKELQMDYDKYGKDAFVFELVEEVPKDIAYDELDELEREYINRFDSFREGYNMTEGGVGNLGRVFSSETRERMSNSHKGVSRHTKDSKNAISESKKARMMVCGEYKVGIQETADELGIHRDTLSKRLKNPNFPEYIKLPNGTSEEEALTQQTKSRTTISKESRLQA